MNMPWNPRERAICLAEAPPAAPSFKVVIRIRVENAGLLWRMATARALAFGDLSHEEIEEMLGPAQDPSIGDCVAMLLAPRAIAGCSFEDFAISSDECREEEQTGFP